LAFYVDTSAYLKLVVAEPESRALRAWVGKQQDGAFASELLRVEALRTARRHSAEAMVLAREGLNAITLVNVTSDICDRAAELDPTIMRSLDAVHLATALSAGDALSCVVTYDQRLAEACLAHGVRVTAPG
jgi:predicted nucleic acid-binding protein